MYIYFYVRYVVDGLQVEHLQSARLLFGSPSGPDGIISALNGRDLGVIHGLGRSPGDTGMTTHSSILAWRIPLDRGAWRPQFLSSQSVQHNWTTKHTQKRLLFAFPEAGERQAPGSKFTINQPPPRNRHFKIHHGSGVHGHPRGGSQVRSSVVIETRSLAWRKTQTWKYWPM